MKYLLSIFVLLAFALTVSAQTQNAKIEKEIIDFRSEIRQAVNAKDRESLERSFADGFTRTASGIHVALNDKRSKVGLGVAGSAAYGNDSPLYGAMGFVRKSDRASGLTRKTKP